MRQSFLYILISIFLIGCDKGEINVQTTKKVKKIFTYSSSSENTPYAFTSFFYDNNWNLTKELISDNPKPVYASTTYEYYDNGYAGENLAPYYTTADQCHGRGVPVYYRPEPGARFEPIPGCYRKGCLYCKEYGTHACKNAELLEAKALKYKDLRSIQVVGNERCWELPESCHAPEDVSALGVEHIYGNPDFMTDAEMWDWELEELE